MKANQRIKKPSLNIVRVFLYTFVKKIMATIKLGMLVTQIAGSVGGTTFRRGKNFTAIVNKTAGASKNKTLQNQKLNQLSVINKGWSLLSPTVRANWEAQALIFQFTDKFGDLKFLTGRQLYTKLGNFTTNAGMAIPDPTTLNSVVEILTLDYCEISLTTGANISFNEELLTDKCALSVELIANLAIQPVYTNRKILLYERVDGSRIITFGEELFNYIPYLQVGNLIRVYFYTQNSSGFKSTVSQIVVEVTE